ncbi:MAG: phytanoyl-CoA dioxygenase family protein [Bacteroidetes bacterium]|nr:phytanoyl-CoA dioxygenase family protein [Bacteroidota bacterium]
MSTNLIIDKERFDKEGFLLVKNVFTKEEIETIRKEAYESFETDKKKNLTFKHPSKMSNAVYAKGDILSKDALRHVLLDERIIQLVKKVLGGDPVYFGDSNYHFGTGFRGFHRDNVDRTDLSAPDWDGDYPIVRLSIYLQDHKNYSGGLKIRVGSHKNPTGKVVFVDSEEGDVAIWTLRTMHSGNAVRLKFFNNLSINKAGREGMVPAFLKKDQQKERATLFITFALKSKHLDRYIQKHVLGREDILGYLKASRFDPKILDLAKQKNLEVLKLIPEYGSLD